MAPPPPRRRVAVAVAVADPSRGGKRACGGCCPRLHEAVELVGRRWTGAILAVLLQGGAMRFSEIAQAVPDLSDRLLAERMRELESRGLVRRTELDVGVQYALTEMGRDLDQSVCELRRWAQRWLG
jgi:DNA-binding HxlR family transcriptional regulator